jgi:hypothetical protein
MDISVKALEEAVSIRRQIDNLERRLSSILGGPPARATAPTQAGRYFSPSTRAKLSAAARARWARLKGGRNQPLPRKKADLRLQGEEACGVNEGALGGKKESRRETRPKRYEHDRTKISTVKIAELRDTYYEATDKVSELVRQLSFAGIAVVWILRTGDHTGGVTYSSELLRPLVLFVASLSCAYYSIYTKAPSGVFSIDITGANIMIMKQMCRYLRSGIGSRYYSSG